MAIVVVMPVGHTAQRIAGLWPHHNLEQRIAGNIGHNTDHTSHYHCRQALLLEQVLPMLQRQDQVVQHFAVRKPLLYPLDILERLIVGHIALLGQVELLQIQHQRGQRSPSHQWIHLSRKNRMIPTSSKPPIPAITAITVVLKPPSPSFPSPVVAGGVHSPVSGS